MQEIGIMRELHTIFSPRIAEDWGQWGFDRRYVDKRSKQNIVLSRCY